VKEFMAGLVASATPSVWADYRPANAKGAAGIPGYVLAPHANTSGTAGGAGSPQGGAQGWDAAVNIQPIPPSSAGTTSAGVTGAAYNPAASGGNTDAAFAAVVTQLVLRNIIENLRKGPVFAQMGSYIRAKSVPGTKSFTYTAFADLGPAQALLEGVPPETERLNFDSNSFSGSQKGKLVAITDLAALISPFELYSVAAEKVAWNAIETLEADLAALTQGADNGIGLTSAATTAAERVIDIVVGMKNAEVPMFPDSTYHCVLSPTDAAIIMKDAGPLGWTDTMKYAGTEDILKGELGKFRGMRFIESTRVADGKSVVFGPEFFAWGDYQTVQAYRVAPGGDHADPLAQRGLVGWKGMWGLSTVSFDGTPAMGPASNIKAERWTQADLTP
jgi:N4-gp56 family major capsid protein